MGIEISRGDAESSKPVAPDALAKLVIPGERQRDPGPTEQEFGWVPARALHPQRLAGMTASNGGVTASPRLRVQNSSVDAATIIAEARSWIGTPYVHQASVKGAGCDCLGLLRGVWRALHGEEPEDAPAYSPDWAEATGAEALRLALSRHLSEIPRASVAPGDVALFRMLKTGPAKHCGIVAERDGTLTLVHARQNRRVREEPFGDAWLARLAYAFRL